MDATVHRVSNVLIGEKNLYNRQDLSGYWFIVYITDESGVESELTLHCNKDCTFEGEFPK